MLLSTVLALMPLLLILVLLMRYKMAIDIAGGMGLTLCILLCIFYFNTSYAVIPPIIASAVLGSLPVGLVIAASIVQITIMAECGALASISAFIKTLTPGQQAVQVLLINVGLGIALTGLGAATVVIFPPLLMALGYSAAASILLPALGYVSSCLYALLGIPTVMLAAFSGQGLTETSIMLSIFMPLVSTCIAFACLHIAGGFKLMRQGIIPAILTGMGFGLSCIALAYLELITVSGILSGLVVIILLLAYVKLCKTPLRDVNTLNDKEKAALQNMSLARACSPWTILFVLALTINTPALQIFDIIFNQYSMPVEIIPNQPERLRLLWQAYTWVIISTIIALPILKIKASTLSLGLNKGCLRALRPLLATCIFFSIAYLMNHSGTQSTWKIIDQDNMVYILAHTATTSLGKAYPAFIPFMGLLAGIIGGSASSAVAMLTKLQVIAADSMQASPILFAVSSGIGGGLAGAISPSKLMSAAATIDKPQEATNVIPYAFALTLVATGACALVTLYLYYII